MKLSNTQREFMVEATKKYSASLKSSPAEEYLESRGLPPSTELGKFRLGYVEEPLPGHEFLKGRLSIPYLRWSPGSGWSVINMKFRCIEDHNCDQENHPKYLSHPGGGVHVFNTVGIQKNQMEIAICEGELDAITSTLAGIPAAGIPGTETWEPKFRLLFLGYKNVWMFADRDDGKGQGMKFANKLRSQIPNLYIIPMPLGEDVNSTVQKYGREALFKAIGREVV